MIWPKFRRQPTRDTITALYGMIVAQARLPVFYRDLGVPDTVNGRFDLVVLHLALVLHRLQADKTAPEGLGQALFDTFCRDMDGNLREMGISDLKVPKEMKRMGEAFYGRIRAYDAALSGDDNAALEQALARNLHGGVPTENAAIIARYMRRSVAALAAQDVAGLAFPVAPEMNPAG